MASSWQLEIKMDVNIFLRPENESARSYYDIWPLGRLHTSRFPCNMGVWVWTRSWYWCFKIIASSGICVRVVCFASSDVCLG